MTQAMTNQEEIAAAREEVRARTIHDPAVAIQYWMEANACPHCGGTAFQTEQALHGTQRYTGGEADAWDETRVNWDSAQTVAVRCDETADGCGAELWRLGDPIPAAADAKGAAA